MSHRQLKRTTGTDDVVDVAETNRGGIFRNADCIVGDRDETIGQHDFPSIHESSSASTSVWIATLLYSTLSCFHS